MLTVQTFLYCQSFSQDRKLFRSLVCFLYALEFAQSALLTADILHWFAIQLGDQASLSLSKPWYSSIDAPVLGGIIALIVQLFFCWRIWTLHGWWPLSVLIGLVSLAGTICALATGIITQQSGTLFTALGNITPYRITWFACSAIANTLIAMVMIYTLVRQPGEDPNPVDVDCLRHIIRMVVETNALTAVVAIIGLVMTLAFPKSEMVMTPAYVLGKIYSNTLMVVLNDRAFLGDTLPRIPRDRALALTRNHEYNRRRLTARLARSSILPVNESPGDFKLKVLQQIEEDIDGKAIGEGHPVV